MRRDRRPTLRIEALEGRSLLSTFAAHRAPRPQALVASGPLQLEGDLEGFPNPGEGAGQSRLKGAVGPLGQVSATLSAPVDPGTGQLLGAEVVLKGRRGTIRLSSATEDFVSDLPGEHYSQAIARYRVRSGTGAYAGASGSGTLVIRTLFPDGHVLLGLHSDPVHSTPDAPRATYRPACVCWAPARR